MSITTNVVNLSIVPEDENTELNLEVASIIESVGNLDAEVEAQFKRWRTLFNLSNDFQLFQLRQLVTESIRLRRCQDEENARRSRIIVRAKLSWEVDRTAEVMAIVAKLPRNPARWRAELLTSAQGCRWMISEWKSLREALKQGGWDTRQRSRAFDLLGISPLYRDGKTVIDPPDGAEPGWLMAQVGRELDMLTRTLEVSRIPVDAFLREQTEQGLTLSFDRETQALRRFEAGCQRRFLQLLKALNPYRIGPSAPARTAPRPQAEPLQERSKPTVRDLAQPSPPKPHETERCSRPDVVVPSVDRSQPDPVRPLPQVPRSSGNRRERRKAAALARKH